MWFVSIIPERAGRETRPQLGERAGRETRPQHENFGRVGRVGRPAHNMALEFYLDPSLRLDASIPDRLNELLAGRRTVVVDARKGH